MSIATNEKRIISETINIGLLKLLIQFCFLFFFELKIKTKINPKAL